MTISIAVNLLSESNKKDIYVMKVKGINEFIPLGRKEFQKKSHRSK